jgi:hypothetical protein
MHWIAGYGLSPVTGIIHCLQALTGTYVSDTQHAILAVNQLAEDDLFIVCAQRAYE